MVDRNLHVLLVHGIYTDYDIFGEVRVIEAPTVEEAEAALENIFEEDNNVESFDIQELSYLKLNPEDSNMIYTLEELKNELERQRLAQSES